jgi:FKBP-type peptidyl-prolyl cis-trans isomerase FkpA
MNITRLLAVLSFAGGVALAFSCDKPADDTTHMTTTQPISITTRPLPDYNAIVKDRRAATEPADDTSTPVGEIKKVTLPDGLIIEDLRIGKGDVVPVNIKATCIYTGWLDDGTIFDDSRPRGAPIPFTLGKGAVIKGWDEGITGMRVGGTRLLTIPPALGYADKKQDKIPPNSTLHFRIQVVKLEKP